jgi:hypothetical protein
MEGAQSGQQLLSVLGQIPEAIDEVIAKLKELNELRSEG